MPSNRVVEQAKSHCTCCWVTKVGTSECEFGLLGDPFGAMCSDKRYRANHGERDGIEDDKICDFVLFLERGSDQIVSPCEFKGANPNVDRAASQLQTGAAIADRVLGGCKPTRFRPLLVSTKVLSPTLRKRLGKLHVTFRANQHPIRWMSCEDDLEGTMLGL